MIKKYIDIKKLNRAEKLYNYLLVNSVGAYYWHYLTEYNLIRQELGLC